MNVITSIVPHSSQSHCRNHSHSSSKHQPRSYPPRRKTSRSNHQEAEPPPKGTSRPPALLLPRTKRRMLAREWLALQEEHHRARRVAAPTTHGRVKLSRLARRRVPRLSSTWRGSFLLRTRCVTCRHWKGPLSRRWTQHISWNDPNWPQSSSKCCSCVDAFALVFLSLVVSLHLIVLVAQFYSLLQSSNFIRCG